MRQTLHLLIVAIACLSAVSAQAVMVAPEIVELQARETLPEWHRPGQSPCQRDDGNHCDPQEVLALLEAAGVYPTAVAADFRQQLADGVTPKATQICRGDTIAISYWSPQNGVMLVRRLYVTFTDKPCEDAEQWLAADPTTGTTYTFFLVKACGNYGAGNLREMGGWFLSEIPALDYLVPVVGLPGGGVTWPRPGSPDMGILPPVTGGPDTPIGDVTPPFDGGPDTPIGGGDGDDGSDNDDGDEIVPAVPLASTLIYFLFLLLLFPALSGWKVLRR